MYQMRGIKDKTSKTVSGLKGLESGLLRREGNNTWEECSFV